jgi:hypothetical protein
MTPSELSTRIARLPEDPPHTTRLERALIKGPTWYQSQRQHWLG